ncbi:putative F-box domain-containing protein [Rosa chinensis]|uniref:Putative F-box domain-containing protein n=1 Tax=Rosa chinensis TaxID=74649 RepID=A0A2P6QA15_ROSCH|nr:putative F-box domain-containing protein [Rosa chinensis]
MGSNSNSKRGEDRISGLPDAILCHILSFLSKVDVVRTSILCHRWEKLWVSVPTLDLRDDSFDQGRGSTPIHKFSLRCTNMDGLSSY